MGDENLKKDPEILGTHLVKVLNENPDTRGIITFIRSGNDSSEDVERYCSIADGFIRKNDHINTVTRLIFDQLERHEDPLQENTAAAAENLVVYSQMMQSVKNQCEQLFDNEYA